MIGSGGVSVGGGGRGVFLGVGVGSLGGPVVGLTSVGLGGTSVAVGAGGWVGITGVGFFRAAVGCATIACIKGTLIV